jgi:hypothetical protein
MAEILSGSIRKSTLTTKDVWTKVTLKDGSVEEFLNFNVTINNEADQYGQIGSITLSQTKEQRMAKTKKNYLANLKRVWSDTPPKLEKSSSNGEIDDQSLPF